ncbi:hypothetical protein HK097_003145 [Rhizophlyctis rosea]|uniref:Cytidyltransferase-like domain-containing protein n=1 Tax=Rhizophlyctis rosea TaxID=64517 RepID=A0AAD5S574_9FUNG|nr:hypothetical protein HK097_003145 [Rhizophlyctis rosea]
MPDDKNSTNAKPTTVIIPITLDSLTTLPKPTLYAIREAATLLSSSRAKTWTNRSHLCIILQCPEITANISTPARIWKPLQKLLAELYVEASNAAAGLGNTLLNVDVIFEDWCGYDPWLREDVELFLGVPEDKPTLATVNIRREKLQIAPLQFHTITPPPSSDSTASVTSSTPTTPSVSASKDIYGHVALGGTFDHLHCGHKILLTTAAWLTKQRLYCGVIDFDPERLKRKKHYQQMEPLQTRLDSVREFLNIIHQDPTVKYEVEAIHDDVGPTRHDGTFEAIVGSAETAKGCEMVNEVRRQNGLNELEVFIVGVIAEDKVDVGEDMASKTSSTSIRAYLEATQAAE